MRKRYTGRISKNASAISSAIAGEYVRLSYGDEKQKLSERRLSQGSNAGSPSVNFGRR